VKHFFKESIVIAVLITTLGIFAAGLGHKMMVLNDSSLAAVYADALVHLTNKDRSKNDLPELQINSRLVEAARLKAEDMATKSYFSHYGPDGMAPWDWIQAAGYDYSFAGENLAVNFTDSKDVEKAWMNSPTHRANILERQFTEIGIATAVGEYNGKRAIFVVQMFGKPKVKTFTEQSAGSVIADTASLVVSNPSHVVLTLYLFMFVFVCIGLLIIVFSEYKKHHMRHMLLGIVMLIAIVTIAWIYRSVLPGIIIA
jgi:hypothetical protein